MRMEYIIKKNAQLHRVIEFERRMNDTEQVGFMLDLTKIHVETGEDWQRRVSEKLKAICRYMQTMS
jgi:hypothetical protein